MDINKRVSFNYKLYALNRFRKWMIIYSKLQWLGWIIIWPFIVCIFQEKLAKRFLIVLKEMFFKHIEATDVDECIREFSWYEGLTTQEIENRLDVSGNKR